MERTVASTNPHIFIPSLKHYKWLKLT